MDNICYLKNICHTKHPLYPELAVKQANEDQDLMPIKESMIELVFTGIILNE